MSLSSRQKTDGPSRLTHLERENGQLRAVLAKIAVQKISGEMHVEDYEVCDFQGSYEAIVKMARKSIGYQQTTREKSDG